MVHDSINVPDELTGTLSEHLVIIQFCSRLQIARLNSYFKQCINFVRNYQIYRKTM